MSRLKVSNSFLHSLAGATDDQREEMLMHWIADSDKSLTKANETANSFAGLSSLSSSASPESLEQHDDTTEVSQITRTMILEINHGCRTQAY